MDYKEQNKAIVRQFNEYIIQGDAASLKQMLAENVVNYSAPKGMPNGQESFHHFLFEVLRKGFSELKVEIFEQIAERDLVCSRKRFSGKHTGELFGIAPTGISVEILVIDIIRIENGLYVEHWGQSNFAEVIAQISAA